ncbi:MAG: hypothetical protein AB1505_11840 [Candidatus Latescibacterota bacterium]
MTPQPGTEELPVEHAIAVLLSGVQHQAVYLRLDRGEYGDPMVELVSGRTRVEWGV